MWSVFFLIRNWSLCFLYSLTLPIKPINLLCFVYLNILKWNILFLKKCIMFFLNSKRKTKTIDYGFHMFGIKARYILEFQASKQMIAFLYHLARKGFKRNKVSEFAQYITNSEYICPQNGLSNISFSKCICFFARTQCHVDKWGYLKCKRFVLLSLFIRNKYQVGII